MDPIKDAAASGAVVALVGGGYLFCDHLSSGEICLTDLDNFDTAYGAGTFGRKYGRYLLDKDSFKNKNKWAELFKKWNGVQRQTSTTPALSAKFAKDKFQNADALKTACETAYKII